MRVRAIGENGIDREHVLARIAVTQRARAAGIVADHAADGGARSGRDVDRKPQARRFQCAIKLVEHDARLDHAAARRGIERDDAVEMPRAIDDQRLVDGLPGLRRAAAARRDRHAFGPANRDRPISFFYRARHRHAERHDLVMRCVGGIAPTRKRVEAHLAHRFRLEPPFELSFKRTFNSWHQPCRHVIPPRLKSSR